MDYDLKIKYLRRKMHEWYAVYGRDFPWRKEGVSNFELIMSEILLQRTKAETVAKYYHVFFKKYPDWDSLSMASLHELEEMLQPLGLFKHRAKRIEKITREYREKQGALPKTKAGLQESNLGSLYVANAYEIFVLEKRAALLDVNMARVLSRYFHPRPLKDMRQEKELQQLAKRVANVKACRELNWAILDFAAVVCTAKAPGCAKCPLQKRCTYFQNIKGKSDS